MKKHSTLAAILMCAACAFLMNGCGGKGSSGSSAEIAAADIKATVIYEIGDGQSISAFANPKIPDTTFRVQTGRCTINVIHENSTHDIFGMPIENAYFADITGDDIPDLCCTLYFGSGIIDSRVLVYDTQTDKEYLLADRENFDYVLYIENDELFAKKIPYSLSIETTEGETGRIAIDGDKLIFVGK